MHNSYLNNQKAVDRLVKEYKEHKNLVIGFDFDCTIYDYHKEELDLYPVIEILQRCSNLGFTMCLHTLVNVNAEMTLFDKIKHCKSLNIKVDYINSSPILNEQPETINSKPFYSILLDDRAGLLASYEILLQTLKELKL